MKRTKKASYFLFGVLTTLLLVNMVVPALAIGLEKLISVSTGVNIYADGVKLDPKDANGNPVDVFIYNGTTYLPVRAVSDAWKHKECLSWYTAWDEAILVDGMPALSNKRI